MNLISRKILQLFQGPPVTTPDSTTVIEEFGIATYGNQGVITTTELPRQEKNIKTLLQPDFSVDVLEEPAAEPISTNGAGWIPLNVDQILGNFQFFVKSDVAN